MYFSTKENRLRTLYNILTHIASFHLKLIAGFNSKLKLGVNGRAETFQILEANIKANDRVIWAHCASLGEFEQGLPVFEALKKERPNHKLVVSFFSPSGYEVKKNTPIADAVVYLPLDTQANAENFIKALHPELAIFVKYEIWPNYLLELRRQNIKAILISATFRENQSLFKFHGGLMLKALKTFDHIFVQNKASEQLLAFKGFKNISCAGDTRFDRVSNQLLQNNHLDFIEAFKQNQLCVVAGSTWPEDEAILGEFINKSDANTKFILAPHNIKSNQIKSFAKTLNKPTVLFSEKDGKDLSQFQVFIVDTIGLLSKIYHYADIAYVGGAMGKTGLHNTLEAAVFGVPIIIGNHYDKFPEASEMINLGGMFSVSNSKELNTTISDLISNADSRTKAGSINRDYIAKNKGAVHQIMSYLSNVK